MGKVPCSFLSSLNHTHHAFITPSSVATSSTVIVGPPDLSCTTAPAFISSGILAAPRFQYFVSGFPSALFYPLNEPADFLFMDSQPPDECSASLRFNAQLVTFYQELFSVKF